MKLLIVTQKVDKNDPILGFFHRWLIEFSKYCEKLTVICLFEGKHDLPKNVIVLSLGKESVIASPRRSRERSLPTGQAGAAESRIGIIIPAKAGIQSFLIRLKYILNFYKYIYHERKNYNTVLVHMNPIYFFLGGIFWKLEGKKTALWYTHRNVDWKLRVAEKFADVIFTASKESFQLKSDKVKVMGHGIPVEDFKNPKQTFEWMPGGKLRIISVGRITPIKNLDTLIEAANILNKKGIDFEITLVGGTINESDEKYLEKLKKMIGEYHLNDKIIFAGSVPNTEIKKYYWENDLSINLCPTGGVDKAVLESMASGLPVLVSNRTFIDYFGKYGEMPIFKERDAKDLADKIIKITESDKIKEIREYLFEEVKNKAGLEDLIKKIVSSLSFPT